jgi:hypothetical protein
VNFSCQDRQGRQNLLQPANALRRAEEMKEKRQHLRQLLDEALETQKRYYGQRHERANFKSRRLGYA